MYAYPVTFPPFSNREDFQQVFGFKDDDTGDLINIAGVTGSGTFALWAVRAGLVITTSNSVLTIPQFPYTSELSALALTVPAGLAITAGNPITLTDGVTGLNTMQGYVTSYNIATGAMVVQIGWTFQFEVRQVDPSRRTWGDGYTAWPAIVGAADVIAPILSGSLADGRLLFVEMNKLMVRIPETIWRRLNLGLYGVGFTATDSYDTRSLTVATIPILYGGVTI